MLSKEKIKEYFENCELREFTSYLGVMFYRLYGISPYNYNFYIDNDDEVKHFDGIKYFTNIEKGLKHHLDTRFFIEHMKNDHNDYIETICMNDGDFLFVGKEIPMLIYLTCSVSKELDSDPYVEVFCLENDVLDVRDLISDCFKPAVKNTEYEFGIATCNGGGNIYTSYYDYTPKNIDIDENYNDDFKIPYEKVCNIIEKKNETGLILFYGEPGTGKSSVIKNLIANYPETDFIFIDATLLASAPQNSLISYFIENQNTVFILEDCEKILMSREEGFNPVISTLLNVTDGIIGDVLGIKLICTFNTSLSKIDKALLRNGRLSLKYEFKKLDAMKASKILNRQIDRNMTLADIYNIDNENDYSKKSTTKVGFSV